MNAKKAKVYKNGTLIIEESISVRFYDKLDLEKSKLVERLANLEITYSGDEGNEAGLEEQEVKDSENAQIEVVKVHIRLRKHRQRSSHFEELILCDKTELVRTKSSFKPSEVALLGLVSLIEPTFIDEALLEKDWILAIQEELNHFSENDGLYEKEVLSKYNLPE